MVTHDIGLTSDVLIRLRPYRSSLRQTEILNTEIKSMLELGMIVKGESDYTSSMILVGTPGRNPRQNVDYGKLNAITRPEKFPSQIIEERVQKVAAARFITVLDLTKRYWQIPMTPRVQRICYKLRLFFASADAFC